MVINGLTAYGRLTEAQLNELRAYAKKSKVRVADLIEHKYDWLISDFT